MSSFEEKKFIRLIGQSHFFSTTSAFRPGFFVDAVKWTSVECAVFNVVIFSEQIVNCNWCNLKLVCIYVQQRNSLSSPNSSNAMTLKLAHLYLLTVLLNTFEYGQEHVFFLYNIFFFIYRRARLKWLWWKWTHAGRVP